MAMELIDAAAAARVDAVKFQTFRAADLLRNDAPKASYQQQSGPEGESQMEMIRQLELSEEDHRAIIAHCQRRDVRFLSTPFDFYSIDLLSSLGLSLFKIPSGEITNLPYLRKIGGLNKDIIVSTGMSDLTEIAAAIHILKTAGADKSITLLHCNTQYPTPFEDANLLAMKTLAEHFNLPVGYSDHTLGAEACIAATALGATVIEKHFTLDRTLPGPDHRASLEPDELSSMVKAIRNVSKALGTGIKKPSPSERHNMTIARKSIVAARTIHKGEAFSEENLTTKRPAMGMNPMLWDDIIGKRATKDFDQDEYIS